MCKINKQEDKIEISAGKYNNIPQNEFLTLIRTLGMDFSLSMINPLSLHTLYKVGN